MACGSLREGIPIVGLGDALIIVVLVVTSALACAQSSSAFPNKPIRFLLGQSPGGGTDILTRLFAQKLTESLGQQVIVDHRPGAGGNIGAEIAAKAPADGYTLFMASAPHFIAPSIYPKLGYDLQADFVPLSLVARQQLCLVVHPSLPVRSVKELVAFLAKRPGQVSYASAGNGSSNHLAMELFRETAAVAMVHVPYKGTGPSTADVLGGQVPVTFGNLLPIMPYVKSGRLRALAVTALKRSTALPDVPTLAESGFDNYEAVNYFAVLTPSAPPEPIVQRLSAEVARIAQARDVQERLATLGTEAVWSTPEETRQFLARETAKWLRVVKKSGARVD